MREMFTNSQVAIAFAGSIDVTCIYAGRLNEQQKIQLMIDTIIKEMMVVRDRSEVLCRKLNVLTETELVASQSNEIAEKANRIAEDSNAISRESNRKARNANVLAAIAILISFIALAVEFRCTPN